MNNFEGKAVDGNELRNVRVWDLPTRLFHWTLALCALGLFVTGQIGGDAMPWHARLGYAVGTLLLFRVAWGVLGGHWSRFATFTRSPRVVLEFIRGRSPDESTIGHSPLGSLSIYAFLVLLAAQVATGLFSANLEEFAGPLNIFVSGATARLLTAYHRNIGEPALLVLIVLHVSAIAYYHLRRHQNLIGPMLHGEKQLAADVTASRDDWRSRFLAVLLLIIAAGAIAGLVSLGGE